MHTFERGDKIPLELDGEVHIFPLTDSFWRRCPEIRGKPVEEWLNNRNVTRGNRGQHAVMLEWKGNRFIPRLIPY